MNEPEPRTTFPTTPDEPARADLAPSAAEERATQKDTAPDGVQPAQDSSPDPADGNDAPPDISDAAQDTQPDGAQPAQDSLPDTADAAQDTEAADNNAATDAAQGSAPADTDTDPDPADDAIDETAVDALLHQVKVAAGVEDDEPEEGDTASGDTDASDAGAGNATPGVTAPVPVAPGRVTSVDTDEVRRVLKQSRATAYATETQRRETLLRQQSDEKRNRTIATALALVLVLALAGFAAYTAWSVVSNQQSQAAWDEAHEPVSTTLSVAMPQLDGVTQGSRIPVSVRGADLDGTAVDETRYMNWDGTGLELVQGSYSLSIPASPIGSDGTLFQVPGDVLSVEVTRDQPDLTGAGTLTFGEIPAADVTDEQINAAKQYAASDGADTTEAALELAALAESKRDAAVAQQRADQEAQAAAERAQYLVSCDLYEFELPEYWRGKVTVRQDGTTAIVYPTGSPNRLCTVFVRPASESSAGDVGNSLIYQTPLANGDMLVVWAPRWGYLVAEAEKNGTAAEKGYTAEMAQTLVDLQSGGTQTYAAVKADVDAHGSDADSIFVVDDFLNETLVSSIELK